MQILPHYYRYTFFSQIYRSILSSIISQGIQSALFQTKYQTVDLLRCNLIMPIFFISLEGLDSNLKKQSVFYIQSWEKVLPVSHIGNNVLFVSWLITWKSELGALTPLCCQTGRNESGEGGWRAAYPGGESYLNSICRQWQLPASSVT